MTSELNGADKVKRTYKIRPDQDRALTLALHRVRMGISEGLPGSGIPGDRSRILQALLDAAGFNQDFIDGEGRVDM